MPARLPFVRDFLLADNTPDDIGELAVGHLAAKGFCLVDAGLSAELLEEVASEAAAIDRAGKLRRPPAEIVEGLLGEEGSSRIATLALWDEGGEAVTSALQDLDAVRDAGKSIGAVDQLMWDVSGYLHAWVPLLGVETQCSRSAATLHETGIATGAAPLLTEVEASEWLYQLSRGFIMLVVSVGPGTGTLQLTPYDEEAEAVDIELPPGSLAVVRCDQIACRHACRGNALLLTSFILDGTVYDEKRSTFVEKNPCVRLLNDWAENRLSELKDMELEDQRPNVPRPWLIAMNKHCFKGQNMAVRGMAIRMPVAWDENVWYCAAFQGVDYMIDVPIVRWRHSERYSPEPDAWRTAQTWARHLAVVDGCELFDNRMFSLTPAESKVMDPQQRIVLENGYEALLRSGYKKGQIMNSTGGMYLGFGTGSSDFNYLEKERDASAEGSFGATGGSAAIAANRFSFCLGMRGPSLSIDAEDASSLVAMHQGCEGLQKRGRLTVNFFSLVGGIKINMSPHWWPQWQAMGLMSPTRCKSFDASADGYVMGDCAVNMALNALTDIVDGQVVMKEYAEMIGMVAGSCVNHNGRSASFNAPNGPAEQEVIAQGLRAAGLSGFDVDGAELYGCGSVLADAIEVSSAARMLRVAEGWQEPIALGTVRTTNGNMSWAAGGAAFAKTLVCNQWGAFAPNLHLHELNPHIDFDAPTSLGDELWESQYASSHVSSMARGFGGLNAFVIAFGTADKVGPRSGGAQEEEEEERPHERLAFWPGGGGRLDAAAVPKRGYHIAGTFTCWEPEPMEMESAGVFAYVLTLGEGRWEQFQIYVDGDPQRCLYPAEHKAGKLSTVEGPAASSGGNAWHIEGRAAPAGQGQAALPAGEGQDASRAGPVDRGWVGAQYRVRLRVAGKYRMVDWERVSGKAEEAELTVALAAAEALPRSLYYVTADWNLWGFEPMAQGEAEAEAEAGTRAALFRYDVRLSRPRGEFQILRNRDFDQVIYPLEAGAPDGDAQNVGGPDEDSNGLAWELEGRPGDAFRIELRQAVEAGVSVMRVSSQRLGSTPLSPEEERLARAAVFSTFGSWDLGVRMRGLLWNGSYHSFLVEAGPEGEVRFQLARDYDWDRLFFPSAADARPGVAHEVLGPAPGDGRSRGLSWRIGGEGDPAKPGEVFEVKVHDKARYWGTGIYKVEWQRAAPGPELEAARAEGRVLGARPRGW